MAKIIISTDNTSDYRKDFMAENGINCIAVKRVQNGEEHSDIFNSDKEFEDFYEQIKKGELPKTSQTNPDEFVVYFNDIFKREKSGDIVHVALSGGLSGTYASAVAAAKELNETNSGRKVYVVDSLLCASALQILVNKLMELRDTTPAEDAVKIITEIRNRLQAHFMVDNLFHLHRGGRVSKSKAIVGSILGAKPLLTVNSEGKLEAISKAFGTKRGVEYLMNLLREHDVNKNGYEGKDIFFIRTTPTDAFKEIVARATAAYPKARISQQLLGTVIATHVGSGLVGMIWEGKSRF